MKYVNEQEGYRGIPVVQSSDISVHDAQVENRFDTLDNILTKQHQDIQKLKSNVKWLYTYGGVGSGSGTGGGSFREWGIHATISNIDGTEPLVLSNGLVLHYLQTVTKKLNVHINYHNNGIYTLTYKAGNQSSKTPILINSSSTVPFECEFTVTLTGNMDNGIVLTVTNTDDGTIKTITCSYLTVLSNFTSVKLYSKKVDSTLTQIAPESGEYFLGADASWNPTVQLHYLVFIADITKLQVGYYVTPSIPGVPSTRPENKNLTEIDISKSKEGLFDIKPFDIKNGDDIIPGGYLANGTAGTYTIQPVVVYTARDQVIEVNPETLKQTYNIIPSSVYIQLRSNITSLFLMKQADQTFSQEDYDQLPQLSLGIRTVQFKVFDGQIQSGTKPYTITILRQRLNSENFEVLESIESLVNVARAQAWSANFSLDYNAEGLWRTTFLINSQTIVGQSYRITYYANIAAQDISVDWFKTSPEGTSKIIDNTIVPVHISAYIRKDASNFKLKNFKSVKNGYLDPGFKLQKDNQEVDQYIKDVEYTLSGFSYLETSKIDKKTYLLDFTDIDLQKTDSLMISIGFLYSDINPTDYANGKFLKIYGALLEQIPGTEQAKNIIDFNSFKALSKYRFINSEADTICVPSEDYNPGDNSKYHLLLYVRLAIPSKDSTMYAEYVYIDGKLEAANPNLEYGVFTPVGIELLQLQVAYNLLEITVFRTGGASTANSLSTLDAAIYRYYVAYKLYYQQRQPTDLDKDLLNGNSFSSWFYFDGEDITIAEPKELKDDEITTFGEDGRRTIYQTYGSACAGQNKPAAYKHISKIAQRSLLPILFLDVSASISSKQKKDMGLWKALCSSNKDLNNVALSAGDPGFEVDVHYSPGLKPLLLQDITNQYADMHDVGSISFYIDMQGTSTRANRSKNMTLSVTNSNTAGGKVSFSPNYDPQDYNTFLPECSWTLKADVTDSAHANNTSIGKFVNELCSNIRPQTYNDFGEASSILKDPHQKVCLAGFPCLVFLSDYVQESEGKVVNTVYYLGYYNFNLGRSSYNNLGYVTLDSLQELKNNVSNTNQADSNNTYFTFSCSPESQHEQLGVAEVSDNAPYFDFSQWDTNLLFEPSSEATSAKVDKARMYTKLISSKPAANQLGLKLLNKAISEAGYYIFKTLGKLFVGDTVRVYDAYNQFTGETKVALLKHAYKLPGVVNTPVTQYTISTMSATGANTATEQYVPLAQKQTYYDTEQVGIGSLISLVCSQKLSDSETTIKNVPLLDYKYSVMYYTVVMAFGMVDSVLKNLNLKSWNVGNQYVTYAPMFYDMDTGFGLNNRAAEAISFNAAMDYWSSRVNNDGYLQQCDVARDYWPQSESTTGFDFPSSYLFGIVKYSLPVIKTALAGDNTNSANTIRNELSFTPQSLWARMRGVSTSLATPTGMLRSADHFMNNYFNTGFDATAGYFISLDYKLKYLYWNKTNPVQLLNTSNFHGTRRQRVKEWLQSRIYFLDSIFNISDRRLLIYDDSAGHQYYEPLGTELWSGFTDSDKAAVNANADIVLLRDAFSRVGEDQITAPSRFAETTTAIITAPMNSPLELVNSESTDKYFLSSNNEPNKLLFLPPNGGVFVPYGSKLWQDITSINAFAFTLVYVNSDNLQSVICDIDNTITTWEITGRRISKIQLTGTMERLARYSGSLKFNGLSETNKMVSLETVNIARTSIELELQSLTSLREVNVAGVKYPSSTNLSITGCHHLENILFEDARYSSGSDNLTDFGPNGKITIKNYHGSIYMTCVVCQEIDITCEEPNQTVYIANNPGLKKLTLTGFKTVVIEKCANIQTISVQDNDFLKCECFAFHPEVQKISGEDHTTPVNILGVIAAKVTDTDTNTGTTGTTGTTNTQWVCNLGGLHNLKAFSLSGYLGDNITLPPHDIILLPASHKDTLYTVNRIWYSVVKDDKGKVVSITEQFSTPSANCNVTTAFANCSNLKTIEFASSETTPSLYICGDGAFSGCSSFTGLDTDTKVDGKEIGRVIFKLGYKGASESEHIKLTSMRSMFASTAVSTETVQKIFALPASGSSEEPVILFPEALTNLSGCFLSCKNIMYNTSTIDWPDFSPYVNVTDISSMFAKCELISYISTELLSFGLPENCNEGDPGFELRIQNFITVPSVTINYSVTAEEKLAEDNPFLGIGKRLKTFWTESSSSKIQLTLLNENGLQTNQVNLSLWLSQFPNVETFANFDIINSTLDCQNAFENNPKLKELQSVFNGVNAENILNIQELFRTSKDSNYLESANTYNGSKLRFVKSLNNVYGSFQVYGAPKTNINIRTFYPWEAKIAEATGNFKFAVFSSQGTVGAGDNFTAWTRVLNITGTGGANNDYQWWWNIYQDYGHLFNSTTGFFANTEVQITVPVGETNTANYQLLPHNINIYNFNALAGIDFSKTNDTLSTARFFYRFRSAYRIGSEADFKLIPVSFWTVEGDKVTKTIFDLFKKVQDISSMFYGVFLADMLPPDFFRKRRESEVSNTWYIYTKETLKVNSYNFNIDDDFSRISGGKFYSYDLTLGNMQQAFNDCKFPVTNIAYRWPAECIEDNYVMIGTSKVVPDKLYYFATCSEDDIDSVGMILSIGTEDALLTTHVTKPANFEWSQINSSSKCTVNISTEGFSEIKVGDSSLIANKPILSNWFTCQETEGLIKEGNANYIGKYLVKINENKVVTFEKKWNGSSYVEISSLEDLPLILNYTIQCSALNFDGPQNNVTAGTYVCEIIDPGNKLQFYAYVVPTAEKSIALKERTYISNVQEFGHSIIHKNIYRFSSWVKKFTNRAVNGDTDDNFNYIINPSVDSEITTSSTEKISIANTSTIEDAVQAMCGWHSRENIKSGDIEWPDNDITNDDNKMTNCCNGLAYPFCTPDIFAACPADGTLLSITLQDKAVNLENVIANWNCCGFIPSDLLKNFTLGNVKISGLYGSIKILPLYHSRVETSRRVRINRAWWTGYEYGTYFYYVPDNYTALTLDLGSKGILNFSIMVPAVDVSVVGSSNTITFYRQVFFIFNKNALSWNKLYQTSGLIPSVYGDIFKTRDTGLNPLNVQDQNLVDTKEEIGQAFLRRYFTNIHLKTAANSTEEALGNTSAGHIRLVLPQYHYEDERFSGLPIYFAGRSVNVSRTLKADQTCIYEGRVFARQDFGEANAENITNYNVQNSEPAPVIETSYRYGFVSPTLMLPIIGKSVASGKSYFISKMEIPSNQTDYANWSLPKFKILSDCNLEEQLTASNTNAAYYRSMEYEIPGTTES